MDGTDEFYLDGESKRSMIMLNNTFENNGSHGKGVFYIGYMLNVDILDGNVFQSNTDKIEFNTEVLTYFIDNGYYLKEYLPQDQQNSCSSLVNINDCHNTRISHLKIENNSCDCDDNTYS